MQFRPKTSAGLTVAVIAAIAIAGAVLLRQTPSAPVTQTGVEEAATLAPNAVSHASTSGPETQSPASLTGHGMQATTLAGKDSELDDTAEVREYRRYRKFQQDIRALFDATRDRPDPTRLDEARRLAEVTRWAEEEEYLLPVEAFGIHVGLLRAVVVDEKERARHIASLQDHYVAAAERERAQIAPDPRMTTYQRRVKDLVSERRTSGEQPLSKTALRALQQEMTTIRREVFHKSKATTGS